MLVLDRNVTLDTNFHIKTSACRFSIYSPCLSHSDFFLLLFLLGKHHCGPSCMSAFEGDPTGQ